MHWIGRRCGAGSLGLLVRRGGPRGHCKGVTGFRSAYGPTVARNCLGIGSPAAEVQAEIWPLQGLCARMECPRDCLALRQDCYSAWPGLGGCGATRAQWRRARHGGAGQAGVLGFWGGGGDGNGAQEGPRAPIKGKPWILGRCAPHGRGGHGRDLRAEETDRGTAQRDPPWVELLEGGHSQADR